MGVRVHLGKLDAFGKAGYGLLVKTGLIGDGTNTQIDDDGLVVTKDGIERVRVGDISGGAGTDYGLKVVNAGATVIIDGTSNMFKIVAAGTTSWTPATPAAGTITDADVVTTLSGLGVQSTIPAHLSFIGTSLITTGHRFIGWANIHSAGPLYAAFVSGGAANFNFLGLQGQAAIRTALDGSGQVTVIIGGEYANSGAAAGTFYATYHVLKEAAL